MKPNLPIYKKYFFLCTIFMLWDFTTYAQFKPEKKSLTAEFQYYPLKSEILMNGLKVRFFLSEKSALTARIGLDIKNTLETNPLKDAAGNKIIGEASLSKAIRAMDVGYEAHKNPSFTGNRLSLYYGLELGFGQNTFYSTYNDESDNTLMEIERALYDFSEQTITDRAFWYLRLGVYLGFDFYIYKGLYVGMNLMYNSYYKSIYGYTVHSSINGMEESFSYNNKTFLGGTDFVLCPIFHLGWRLK